MSTNQYTDDFDFDDESDLSGSDLVKKLRKQLAETTKALKERDTMMAEMQYMVHQQSVSQMLQELGLDPRMADFIPDDVQSEQELGEWLDQYGPVFGVVAVDDDEEYDTSRQASELMYEVEQGSVDPNVGFDLANQIEAAQSPDELLAMLRGQ